MKAGFVYVIGPKGKNLCKVGVTTRSPHSRLKQLQVGSTAELNLHGAFRSAAPHEVEDAVHTKLANRRLHGEWFKVTPKRALGTIERVIAKTKRLAAPAATVGLCKAAEIVGRPKSTMLHLAKSGKIPTERDAAGRLRFDRKMLAVHFRSNNDPAMRAPHRFSFTLTQLELARFEELARLMSEDEGCKVSVSLAVRRAFVGKAFELIQEIEARRAKQAS